MVKKPVCILTSRKSPAEAGRRCGFHGAGAQREALPLHQQPSGQTGQFSKPAQADPVLKESDFNDRLSSQVPPEGAAGSGPRNGRHPGADELQRRGHRAHHLRLGALHRHARGSPPRSDAPLGRKAEPWLNVSVPQVELIYYVFGRHKFPGAITANLERFVRRFNEVQHWVVTDLCLCADLVKRAALLKKFIKIAAV